MMSSTTIPESDRALIPQNEVIQTKESLNYQPPDVEVQMINLPPAPVRSKQYIILQVPTHEVMRSRRLVRTIKLLLLLVLLFVLFGLIGCLISIR